MLGLLLFVMNILCLSDAVGPTISCHLCRGPKFICERAHAPQLCTKPGHQFCINDVENLQDGSRYVTRRCATEAECEKDWIEETADRNECKLYSVDTLQRAHFSCAFCCKGENCNDEAVPKSLYRDANTSHLYPSNIPLAKIPHEHYVATTGENVTIECKVANADAVYWYKDNKLINKSDIQNPNLLIIDVRLADRGGYKCVVINKFGQYSDATSLKVVHTFIPRSSYEKTANESVTLQCLIFDATEVKWRHNEMYILTENGRYSGGNITVPSLTLTHLTTDDGGLYKCESLFESVFSVSSGIALKIRDKPRVKSFEDNVQATVGRNLIIPCSFDSYPEPTGVFWTKDDNILNVTDSKKYNGSTVQVPSLTIYSIDNTDYGIYVCCVKNAIGKGLGKSVKLAARKPSESLNILGPVAGGVSGGIVVVVIVVVVLFIFMKRKWTTTTQNHDYEKRDHTTVDLHLYDETQMPYSTNNKSNVYVNTPKHLTNIENDIDTTFTLNDVRDLMRVLNDKSLLARQIKAEYQILTSKPILKVTSGYENVDIKSGAATFEDYTNKSLIKKQDERVGYIIATLPDQTDIENFWTMVTDYHVSYILLLLKKMEKISEFFPKSDDPIITQQFKVEVSSFEKNQNNIFEFVLDIWNKEKKTTGQVKLYKTIDWKVEEKYPSIDTICKLLDVVIKEPGMIALIGSNGFGFPVCGVLGACYEMFNAINNEKDFNILQIVVCIKRMRPDLFKTFEEYNLCYKVIEQFLQNEHTYAVIDEKI